MAGTEEQHRRKPPVESRRGSDAPEGKENHRRAKQALKQNLTGRIDGEEQQKLGEANGPGIEAGKVAAVKHVGLVGGERRGVNFRLVRRPRHVAGEEQPEQQRSRDQQRQRLRMRKGFRQQRPEFRPAGPQRPQHHEDEESEQQKRTWLFQTQEQCAE